MVFSEFCEVGQLNWFSCSSQAQYLKGLFRAAGITREYSDDYLKAVYSGTTKSLNSNMKKHFPKPVDESKIADYYEKHIKDEFVAALCDAFAIPANLEKNKKLLSIAMARQVAVFIGSKDDTVDCIVASAYENAVVSEAVARYEIPKRLYDGDDLWVEQYDRCHAVGCYQKFTHQYGTTNEVTIQLQRYGFSRESATYIKAHPQYFTVDGEGNVHVKNDLENCGDNEVVQQIPDIRFNTPELFVE